MDEYEDTDVRVCGHTHTHTHTNNMQEYEDTYVRVSVALLVCSLKLLVYES
jgi:hypothetical protein